jgi:hypothetical protein
MPHLVFNNILKSMFQNTKPCSNDWTYKVSGDIGGFILGI